MWTDSLEPRTTAERLRMARRRETAALYEQSLLRRRCNSLQDAQSPAGVKGLLGCAMKEERIVEDGVPVTARTSATTAVSTDNITEPATTLCECSSFTGSYLGRPLRVLSANWGRSDAPQRRSWCSHSSGPRSSDSSRGQKKASVLLHPPSAATTRLGDASNSSFGGTVAPLTTMPRERLHSSSSSFSFACGSVTNASRPLSKSSRQSVTTRVIPSSGVGHDGGNLILSNEEYQRIRQIISLS